MNEGTFKTALSAISAEEYDADDIKSVKKWLEELRTRESVIKREIEQEKNNYVKKKGKATSKLKKVKNEIKNVNNILKKLKEAE